jgi:hypothetical protein
MYKIQGRLHTREINVYGSRYEKAWIGGWVTPFLPHRSVQGSKIVDQPAWLQRSGMPAPKQRKYGIPVGGGFDCVDCDGRVASHELIIECTVELGTKAKSKHLLTGPTDFDFANENSQDE